MSSIETEADDNSPLEPAVGRTDDAGPDIGQQVHDFPQDASDEAFGQFLREHHAKKLRAACTQLGLHPQADPSTNHKDGYITLLGQYRRARLRGEVFSGYPRIKSKQKKGPATIEVDGRTKHCGFRLANVLFSPTFFCRMVESGALPSTGLEVDTVDGRAKFWREVAMAFASENPQFDVVVGQSGPYEGIDPRLAPHHSSAKLCAIWKDMTTRYEESLARWKQLGTDKVGFAHFCGDYLDGLYLHDWLQIRPIPLDPEQVRASKRARTGNVQQGNESTTSTGADSDVERRNFLTPHDVEAATQDQTSSTGKTQVPILREFVVNPSAAQARGHRELFTTRHLPTQRRILPRAGPSQAAVQRQSVQTQVQQETPIPRQSPGTLEEGLLRILDANSERRVNKYDGVIYSSQAVRDTMSAIEALKRGRFDSAVIAQAEESMDAIVQVWLRELDKAGQGRGD